MFKLRFKLAASSLLLVSVLLSASAAVHGQTTLEWMVLARAGEGFSVSLPVKPEEDTDRMTTDGKVYKMRLYTSVDGATGLIYMVAMQEFPPAVERLSSALRLEQFMDGFKEGLNKSLGGLSDAKLDLRRDRDLDLKGHLGLQYTLSLGQTRGLVRAFDGSPRMYVLLVMGAEEKDANVVRFFDSFEIKAAPAPVPEPATEVKP